MNKADRKIELLAPAGSPQALRSAVLNGADAVYLGSNEFSARDSAANFSDEQLYEAIRFCKLHMVKVFLAVNIMFLENEIENLMRLAAYACKIGVDGFIVSDIGAAALLKKHFPDVPIHASTQMTVHSLEGVRLLEGMGFTRVVLSRELSKEETEYISANCKAEIEVFVHGALCMSYSGKCLMSSMIGKRSGNRGKCAQPCRMQYTLEGAKGFLLSPRDLCLIDDVGDLINGGVTSLKIEGRMKSPEYVAVVTSSYRKAIDEGRVTLEDKNRLKEIFCRGGEFTRAYYGGEKTKTILNTQLSNDDTGRTASEKLLKAAASTYREGAEIKKIPVNINVVSNKNEAVFEFFALDYNEKITAVMTDTPAILAQRLCDQLSKMGGTPFFTDRVSVEGEIRLRISEVNEIRRAAIKLLTDKITKTEQKIQIPFENKCKKVNKLCKKVNKTCKKMLIPCVFDAGQAKALINKTEKMYVPLHIVNDLDRTDGICAVLPVIIKKEEKDSVYSDINRAKKRGIEYALCHSLDAVAIAKENELKIIAGAGLNIANSYSADEAIRFGAQRIMTSTEISLERIKTISEATDKEVEAIIYGRLPLMITENCIMSGKKCSECQSEIKDRMGTLFPVRRTGYSCRNYIFNSRPIYIADKDYQGYGLKYGILYFTTESPTECEQILDKYKNAGTYDGEFTRGYLFGGKL